MAKSTVSLYRHFDSAGTLLYVGISLSAIARLVQHKSSKSKWPQEIASMTVEHFPDRESAAAAEILAILNESPLHNVAGKTSRGVSPKSRGVRKPTGRRPGRPKKTPEGFDRTAYMRDYMARRRASKSA